VTNEDQQSHWVEMTPEARRWSEMKEVLHLQMLASTFYHLFRGSHLTSLDPVVLEVRDEGVKEMLELHWAERVAEALGAASVRFEVAEGGNDVI